MGERERIPELSHPRYSVTHFGQQVPMPPFASRLLEIQNRRDQIIGVWFSCGHKATKRSPPSTFLSEPKDEH